MSGERKTINEIANEITSLTQNDYFTGTQGGVSFKIKAINLLKKIFSDLSLAGDLVFTTNEKGLVMNIGNLATTIDLSDSEDISTADLIARLFRNTNTTGTCELIIYAGDGTDTEKHKLSNNGTALHAGKLTVSSGGADITGDLYLSGKKDIDTDTRYLHGTYSEDAVFNKLKDYVPSIGDKLQVNGSWQNSSYMYTISYVERTASDAITIYHAILNGASDFNVVENVTDTRVYSISW
jgi:hypothetical protein